MNGRASDETRSRAARAAASSGERSASRPEPDLQDAVDRFGRAFDDAERDGAGAEHARQEERQERIDGLSRRVGGEAHPPEEPDRSGEVEHGEGRTQSAEARRLRSQRLSAHAELSTLPRRTIEWSMSTLAEVLARETREGELYERAAGRPAALLRVRPLLSAARRRASASARCASTRAAACGCRGATSAACSAIRSRRSRSSTRIPGALAYSFGMLGCDLHCGYCQNWVTSQALRDPRGGRAAARSVARSARRATRCAWARASIVSTYNEPLITSEWAVAVFKEAKAAGLDDRLRVERQRHAAGARVPAAVGRSLQGRSQELRRSPLPAARRPARADPRHDPPAARDGLLGRDRHAAHPGLQRLAATS